MISNHFTNNYVSWYPGNIICFLFIYFIWSFLRPVETNKCAPKQTLWNFHLHKTHNWSITCGRIFCRCLSAEETLHRLCSSFLFPGTDLFPGMLQQAVLKHIWKLCEVADKYFIPPVMLTFGAIDSRTKGSCRQNKALFSSFQLDKSFLQSLLLFKKICLQYCACSGCSEQQITAIPVHIFFFLLASVLPLPPLSLLNV